MTREEVIKKTVYLFKQFARKNNFWEEYKCSSRPMIGLPHFPRKYSFKEVVGMCEPVELLQSSTYFCLWLDHKPRKCSKKWNELSEEWARICIENNLFFNRDRGIRYVGVYISNNLLNELNIKWIL